MQITCPSCDFTKSIPDDKIPQGAKWVRCPKCKNRFDFTLQNKRIAVDDKPINIFSNRPSLRRPSPWEDRAEIGSLKGIISTIKQVLFSPKLFFRKTAHNLGIIEPFAFGLLAGSIGGMLNIFWDFLFRSDQFATIADFLPFDLSLNIIFLCLIVLIPFLNIFWMLLACIFFHISLVLVRGNKGGFEATFRVIAFSQAAQLLGIIPYLGGLMGFVWNIVVLIIGIREIHETTYSRTIIAFLIPILFIFLLSLLLASAFSILIGQITN